MATLPQLAKRAVRTEHTVQDCHDFLPHDDDDEWLLS